MAWRAKDYRAQLTALEAKAATNNRSLRAQILAEVVDLVSASDQSAGGSIRRSKSADTEVEFSLPQDGGPGGVAGNLQAILDAHDQAKAVLIAAGTPTPTDAAVIVQMKAWPPFVAVRSAGFYAGVIQ